jgi:hypothetical protein
MNLDPAPRQKRASQNPSRPASCVMITRVYRPAGSCGTRLQPFDQLHQRRPIRLDHMPRMLLHARKLNGEHPLFRTQLQSVNQSAVVIENGGRRRRILIPPCGGSNPPAPANDFNWLDNAEKFIFLRGYRRATTKRSGQVAGNAVWRAQVSRGVFWSARLSRPATPGRSFLGKQTLLSRATANAGCVGCESKASAAFFGLISHTTARHSDGHGCARWR